MSHIIVKNEDEVIQRLLTEFENRAKIGIAENFYFRVGLSGGSLINYLCKIIPKIKTDFSRWRLFFCDERFVPESDPESIYGAYKRALMPLTTLKEEQFFKINTNLTLEECAKDYEQKILNEFENEMDGDVPEFDLFLLGMGPDGHTCSLFPNHVLLKERFRLIAPIYDSPKPPQRRITMTYPLINNAECCIFVICGSAKADAVKRIFVDMEGLPAALVSPIGGNLKFIFDQAAGSCLM